MIMARNIQIEDPITNLLREFVGKIDKELEDLIVTLMEERINLSDMITSALTKSHFFENPRMDININPEYPTVYFTVKDRTGRTPPSSAIIVKGNGSVHADIYAPSEIRETVQAQLQDLLKTNMINKKLEDIKEMAQNLQIMLEERMQ